MARGRLPAADPMATLRGVGSVLQCAQRCRVDFPCTCRSHGYNADRRLCHLYALQYSGDLLTGSPAGVDYFEEFQAEENAACGAVCTENSACAGCNMECRDGTCQCVIGYFNPSPGTCVTSCPNGYGDGFYKVENWTLHGDSFFLIHLSWESVCRSFCLKRPACRSFVHSPGICALFNTTKLEHPEDWKVSTGPTPPSYYQRHCA